MTAFTPWGVLGLVAGLLVKHMLCDGPLQSRAMVDEKGTYGRPRGLLHAGLHALGTLVVMLLAGLTGGASLLLALADGVVHYHVDFTKERLVRSNGWSSKDSPFWWVLAVDQGIHDLTYVGLVAVLITWTGSA